LIEKILLKENELLPYTELNDFGSAAKFLLEKQKNEWLLLNNGYKSLDTIKIKSFQFPGYKIKIQFNPGRMISSSAKVDPQSIKERKCFLCIQNLPEEQKGILYNNNLLILCNPFPIFPEHFTIPDVIHKPQEIKNNFPDLISLTRDFSKYYNVLYNGPRCGASAPDHFHFQAGSKFFMPIDNEFEQIKNEYGAPIFESEEIIVSSIDDSLRRFIAIESDNPQKIIEAFNKFYEIYNSAIEGTEEPMMNIISFYDHRFGWRVLIFLREKHRSSHYFAEGDKKILISIASVDLGGVCITPVEKDFEKINRGVIEEIFREISLNKELFVFISSDLEKKLNFSK
jgi:hypothetical protein